jgi:two-component system chemotaxis response regulator CheV
MAKAVGYPAIEPEEYSKAFIIITDCWRKEVGFLVRGIDKIVDCNWKEIDSPPNNLGPNAFLTGVINMSGKLIQILDVELLMSKVFPEDPEANQVILTDVQREKLKPKNILLVDDSFVARKQLSDALDSINIPYQVTSNGQQALSMMQQGALDGKVVDILVSDIEMPGLDGYELSFEVRDNASLKGAYIILHTSLSSNISISQAHQVGANEALTKFDAQELIEAMLRGVDYVDQQQGIA